MDDQSNDPTPSVDAEQDLLSNIDLSSLQGFGLDRFLPTRNEDEPSGSGERQQDGEVRVGEVRRREEDEVQKPGGTGKRRRVGTSGSGNDGVDGDELNHRQEEQPEGQGSGRNTLDGNEQEDSNQANPDDGQEDGTATSNANNADLSPSPTPSPINNHTPVDADDDQNDMVDNKEGDDEMTPERRRERQKELNRLAALRSRGKKRGSYSAVLEQTITTIQEENARLRTRLEGLLRLASNHNNHNSRSVQPVASGSGTHAVSEEGLDTLPATGSGSAPGSGMLHIDMGPGMEVDLGGDGRQVGADGDGEEGTGDGEDMVVNGNLDNNNIDGNIEMHNSSGMQLPATSSTIPGQSERRLSVDAELGLDISRLGALQRELDGLRRRAEERSELQAASLDSDANNATGSGNVVKEEDDDERTALLAHVRYLKEENDRISRQRKTLEREIEKRKILLASRERLQETGEDGSKAEDGADGEKGDGVGVERALLTVRGWLDDALRTWSATGILAVPAEYPDAIPLPVTRRIVRPRKEKKTRRGRPAGESTRAESQDPDEIDPDLSHDTENELDDQELDREDDPTIDVVDPDLAVAVDGHDPATTNAQTEEAQAQQNLQRILAMYSASAGGGDTDTGVDGVGSEGQDGEGDVHMQDMAGGREEGTDLMAAFLARRP